MEVFASDVAQSIRYVFSEEEAKDILTKYVPRDRKNNNPKKKLKGQYASILMACFEEMGLNSPANISSIIKSGIDVKPAEVFDPKKSYS